MAQQYWQLGFVACSGKPPCPHGKERRGMQHYHKPTDKAMRQFYSPGVRNGRIVMDHLVPGKGGR